MATVCLGRALFKKALATSGFLMFVRGTLVEKTLGGTLVKKLLAISSLLLLKSSFLVKKALVGCRLVSAGQFVHNPLPVLVGLFCLGSTPGKNRSPQWRWWQKPRSLVVFAPGSTQPIIIEMGASILFVIHPVEGARGRLPSFELQPTGRIDGVVHGRRQMSRR